VKKMAKQIADQIDDEILQDLYAMSKVDENL
jgi:hypothetical protein